MTPVERVELALRRARAKAQVNGVAWELIHLLDGMVDEMMAEARAEALAEKEKKVHG